MGNDAEIVENAVYTLNGKTYKSIPEIAKDYKIPESKLRSRLIYGYSLEESLLDQRRFREISYERRRMRENKEFVYGDVVYSTLRKLAKAMNISYEEVLRSFESGVIECVEIREKEINPRKVRVYKTRVFAEVDDVTYRTCKEYVDAFDLNMNTFRGYLRKNYSVADATRLTIEKQKGFLFDGEYHRSLLSISKVADVMYSRLMSAYKLMGNADDAVQYARDTAKLQTRRYKKNT